MLSRLDCEICNPRMEQVIKSVLGDILVVYVELTIALRAIKPTYPYGNICILKIVIYSYGNTFISSFYGLLTTLRNILKCISPSAVHRIM